MEQQFMHKVQRSSDSVWSLPAHTSTTLSIGPGPRVLQVCEGRLWLTTAGSARAASMDVWLLPGDSVELPAGLSVVMEAWPSARFQLLVPPASCRTAWRGPGVLSRAAAWIAHQLRGRGAAVLQPNGPCAP